MRRKNVISRFATLALATLACLLLAVLAPMLLSQRATDEPFSGYAVMASPRDMHVVTSPIRLSDAPDLTLNRGTLYADGNAAAGTPISRFVLDGPVFYLNASGLRTAAASFEASLAGPSVDGDCAAAGRAADRHGLRRAHHAPRHALRDGGGRQLGDDRRHPGRADRAAQGPGLAAAAASRSAASGSPSMPRSLPASRSATPPRWPMKLALKGDLLEASFDGHLDVGEELAALRPGRAVDAQPAPGVRAGSACRCRAPRGSTPLRVKGQINWARHTLAFEDAKVTIDGNEASGALVLNLAGERPLIDGTLAFNALDLTPYVEAARSQSFLFDRQTASWSAFDLSFPIIQPCRCRLAHLGAEGRHQGLRARPRRRHHHRALGQAARRHRRARAATPARSARRSPPTANELVPRYTAARQGRELRGGPRRDGAVRRSGAHRPLDALPRPHRCRADAGRDPARAVGQGGPHHGRRRPRGLDIKALRAAAKADGPPGWGLLAKGQTSLEQVEARALIRDGVLITETVQARSGAVGRRRLRPRRPGRAHARPAPLREAQCAGGQAAQAGRHGRRRGRDACAARGRSPSCAPSSPAPTRR